MPATVDNNPTSEVSPTRRDSTFSYEPSPLLHSTDIRIASEQIRKASIDSGVNMLPSRTSISPMSRTSSNSECNIHIGHRNSTCSTTSLNDLFLEKMLILEKKLQSMESQLKNEQVQRLALEAKVVKLERDNEQLKSARAQAGQQLQNFAELFYSETETIKIRGSSCFSSPHPSQVELRRRSRTDSLSSNTSSGSFHSRNSHHLSRVSV